MKTRDPFKDGYYDDIEEEMEQVVAAFKSLLGKGFTPESAHFLLSGEMADEIYRERITRKSRVFVLKHGETIDT